MRVNLTMQQPGHSVINTARINASVARNHPDGGRAKAGHMKKDRVNLSPQGKLMSMIENLRKQKEAVLKNRNDLVESTLKNGGKVEDIKEQLKYYGKQLEQIDHQISDAYASQAKQAVEQDDQKKPGRDDGHKTRQQRDAEHMSRLAGASADLKHAEKIAAAQDKAEGDARVQEAEIHMGGIHIDKLESKGMGTGANVGDMIENENRSLEAKRKQAGRLWDSAMDLQESQGDKLKEAREQIDEKP